MSEKIIESRRILTNFIKEQARKLGFDIVGITTPQGFEETQARLVEHIEKGRISGLSWFTAERAAISCDPANLLPEVRSIISLGISYRQTENEVATPAEAEKQTRGKVARYAWGKDYHEVLKEKMQQLFSKIQLQTGSENARFLVDTARIVDRAVAQKAGLGFYGKNTNLINKQFGSFFFIAEILTDLELEYDAPVWGTCGKCTRCLDACPTGAITEPWVVHNDLCISYLTIELKGAIPLELRSKMGDWIFGCDICQEVCPYNKKATAGNHLEFAPNEPEDSQPDLFGWLKLTARQEEFKQKFKATPLLRSKRTGLRRNIAVALGNSADTTALPEIATALENEADPMVREHLEWARAQITKRFGLE